MLRLWLNRNANSYAHRWWQRRKVNPFSQLSLHLTCSFRYAIHCAREQVSGNLPELQWNNKLTFPYGKCCLTNSAAHSVHIHDHRMMLVLAQSQTACILRPFKIHLIASAIHGCVLFLSPCLPQEGSHLGQLITMQVCWANRRNGSNVSPNNIHKSQLNMILIMPHDVSWCT